MSVDPGADITGRVPPEEQLRADFYGFLSALLSAPPDEPALRRAAALSGGDDPMGKAARGLAAVAKSVTPEMARAEFHDLFIGLGRGELLPYASVYLSGFLNEKPLAALRADMLRLGMQRAEDRFEPEDNIASLCEMMAGLILGRFGGGPASLAIQRGFFNAHLGPWAKHFFTDLEAAKASVFYAPVGAMGRLFMEIEAEAFRMETA